MVRTLTFIQSAVRNDPLGESEHRNKQDPTYVKLDHSDCFTQNILKEKSTVRMKQLEAY